MDFNWAIDEAARDHLPVWCRGTVYTRPLCFGEELARPIKLTVPGHSDIIMTFRLRSDIPINATDVRRAFTSLRQTQPAVAAVILQDPPHTSGRPLVTYSIPQGQEDVDEWLSHAVVAHRMSPGFAEEDLRLLVSRTPDKTLHALTFHYAYSEEPEQVGEWCILEFAHECTDAVGAMILFDIFISELQRAMQNRDKGDLQFIWGTEVEKLTKALPERFQDASIHDTAGNYSAFIDGLLETLTRPSTIGVGFDRSDSPTTSLVCVRNISSVQLRKFLDVAHSNGTTFFPLFVSVTALALIRREYGSSPSAEGEGQRITLFPVPVDLRRRLPDRNRAREPGFSLSHFAVGADFTFSSSEHDLMVAIAQQISQCLKEAEIPLRNTTSWWYDFMDAFVTMRQAATAGIGEAPAPPSPSFPAVSSLGDVTPLISFKSTSSLRFESLVTSVRFTLPSAPVVSAWTLDHKLAFSISYPACAYSREKMEGFADEIEQIIMEM